MNRSMLFSYEDLAHEQFETLIVILCQRLLGTSVKGFAKGPDGGRDAKFVGTAELHPSKAAPWSGTTIIQAKHTNGCNRHFGESDFYNPKSENTVLGKEIPRIKTLRAGGGLDHYMLFANRRLTGNIDQEISNYIASGAGVPESSIYICGVEQLELWLRQFSDVPQLANLDRVDSPLIVNSEDLAVVVQAIAKTALDGGLGSDVPPTERTSFQDKNVLNNMTPEYAKEQRKRHLKEVAQIRTFLAAPENADVLRFYEAAVEEFQLKIIAKRKDYQSFDEIMNYLTDLLIGRDPILRTIQNKRLTRALLFYMYWDCDIGQVTDA